MIEKKLTIFDQLNHFSIGIIIATGGFITYLFARVGKFIADKLCESVMDKYTKSVRDEAGLVVKENIKIVEESFDKKFIVIKKDIKEIKDSMKTEKERNHDSIAKNEAVLGLALEQLERFDKKLDEKTIINIPTSKRKG